MNIGKPGKWRIWISWRYPWFRWFPTPRVTINMENATTLYTNIPPDERVAVTVPQSATQEGGAKVMLTLNNGDQWLCDPADLEKLHVSLLKDIKLGAGWQALRPRLPWLTRISRGWIW